MIGGSEREKKFVALIVQQVREGAKEIFVVTDKLGTPTYNLDFARGLARLIESTHTGKYHLSIVGGNISRFEVARKILDVLARTDVQLTEVTSDSEIIRRSLSPPYDLVLRGDGQRQDGAARNRLHAALGCRPRGIPAERVREGHPTSSALVEHAG